jgi:hypothetical protein
MPAELSRGDDDVHELEAIPGPLVDTCCPRKTSVNRASPPIGEDGAVGHHAPEDLLDTRPRRGLLRDALHYDGTRRDEQFGGWRRETIRFRNVIPEGIRRDVFRRVRGLRSVTSVTVDANVTT